MEYTFDTAAADRVCEFFATCLRHVEGEFLGQPFTLQPWQKKILRDVFGWKRPDGTRRYRTAYVEIPRKNGKSTLAAGIALYLLLCDNEPRAQVYSAAGDQKQARIVYDTARDMVKADLLLSEECDLYQYRINGKRLNSFYTAISAEAYSKHGFNAHGIIFDELHVQTTRELWDVLATSTGARRQPLTVAITTAGWNRQSICWDIHQKAKAIIDGNITEDSFYPVIFNAETDDDWTDERTWRKANPNLGVSVKLDYLQSACEAAKNDPAAENTFRNLHLNQWTEQAIRAISMHSWDACKESFDKESLTGEVCYAAMDLASTRDITAIVLAFPRDDGRVLFLPYFFAPEDAKDKRTKNDRQSLMPFIRDGSIMTTEGDETDYGAVRKLFYELAERYDIRGVAFDPWNARTLKQWLVEDGYPLDQMKEFPQTIVRFAEPTAEFLVRIKRRQIIHDGNKVLRWMASNTAMRSDASGNLRPDKAKSAEKIDGIVAAIMALAMVLQGDEISTYHGRGIVTI